MNRPPLLLETLSRRCSILLKKNQLPLVSSILVGLLCYGYAFTNKLVNHDEVQSLFIKGATVTSGRWGLGALDSIFPNYSMPWIYGIITIFLIAAASCLIIRILSIQNPVLQVLLGGTIMAFPSLIGTFAYMFTASSFGLSFLMAVLAVWLLQRKGTWHWLCALGCMVFSLSIYQSYISVAAGLLVVELLQRTLHKEDFTALLRRGIGYVLFLGAALGLYYGATQVIFLLLDVTFNDYASGNLGFSLAAIPASIAEAYKSFVRFFSEGYHGLICGSFSQVLHLLCLFCIGVFAAAQMRRTASLPHILLGSALILILPLAMNCMYLFTTANAVHTLVLYGFIVFYVLLVMLADLTLNQTKLCALTANLVTLALAAIIICNTYLANQIWLNLQLRYENAYSFYTSLLSDLRQLPQFDGNTPVALVGSYQDPVFYENHFESTAGITGTKGFLPDSYSKDRFMEYYLGIDLPFATEEECAALAELPQVEQMPAYPYYGSIASIDGVIVIKLS